MFYFRAANFTSVSYSRTCIEGWKGHLRWVVKGLNKEEKGLFRYNPTEEDT